MTTNTNTTSRGRASSIALMNVKNTFLHVVEKKTENDEILVIPRSRRKTTAIGHLDDGPFTNEMATIPEEDTYINKCLFDFEVHQESQQLKRSKSLIFELHTDDDADTISPEQPTVTNRQRNQSIVVEFFDNDQDRRDQWGVQECKEVVCESPREAQIERNATPPTHPSLTKDEHNGDIQEDSCQNEIPYVVPYEATGVPTGSIFTATAHRNMHNPYACMWPNSYPYGSIPYGYEQMPYTPYQMPPEFEPEYNDQVYQQEENDDTREDDEEDPILTLRLSEEPFMMCQQHYQHSPPPYNLPQLNNLCSYNSINMSNMNQTTNSPGPSSSRSGLSNNYHYALPFYSSDLYSKLHSINPDLLESVRRLEFKSILKNIDINDPTHLAYKTFFEENTVMLRHIPNKYSQSDLLHYFYREGFKGLFNFVYLPIDFKNGCNMGYCFVNFISKEALNDFTRVFSDYQLPAVKSSKYCAVTSARVNGLLNNILHYIHSPIVTMYDDLTCQPVLFELNGQMVTFPRENDLPVNCFKDGSARNPRKPIVNNQSTLNYLRNNNVVIESENRSPRNSILDKTNTSYATSTSVSSHPPMSLSKLLNDYPYKLFVGGLSPKTDEQKLISYFQKFVKTDTSNTSLPPVNAYVVRSKDSGSHHGETASRCFGYVVFSQYNSLRQCLNCTNGHIIDGKSIGLRPYSNRN